ncbi:branched-chain amino acid ABC transporter permease [Alkalilimnicola sp. S0819]|nr:branched-chain amino acid ABC transporter permease [Alkalilimnicola sp. S0819]MPQ16526.1 branched-chain amino acid ABC transporter permease [Alkalilimnicola sp. S0819]
MIAPMLPGIFPFGLTAGVAAVDAGLAPAHGIGASILIYAGASQLVVMQLIGDGALPMIMVLTAYVVNLRFAMYSAGLAPHFSHLPRRWQWPLAYMITDQAYTLTVLRAEQHPSRTDAVPFYLGAAGVMWLVWQIATAIGAFVGALVPSSWSLGFAVPLIFMGMLVLAVNDKPTMVAAVVGGAVALLGHALPMNLGLFLGAVAGIAAGVLAEWRLGRGKA